MNRTTDAALDVRRGRAAACWALRKVIALACTMIVIFYAGVGFEHLHRHHVPTVKPDPSAVRLV